MSSPDIVVVTTRHWGGDPRLNRHLEYLRAAGHTATLTTFSEHRRSTALLEALREVGRTKARFVLLPDPELFFVGSIVSRLTGKRPVIDIHEDYPKAAMAREWIPGPLRPLARVAARLAMVLGRLAAWRVMVAAPELARDGDVTVYNMPDPARFAPAEHDGSRRLVYVGDITPARGAMEMIRLVSHLDNSFELLMIGRIDARLAQELNGLARDLNVSARLRLTGRLDHDEAWDLARGALAGLNLLAPVPAYRDAVATKLWEYMAAGLPAIVSDLPGQANLLRRVDPDLVCGSAQSAAAIAVELSQNPVRRASIAKAGRALVEEAWAKSRPDLAIQSIVEP
ncbi:MAG: glycosyltransferase [Acidimicrobiia bacterium]